MPGGRSDERGYTRCPCSPPTTRYANAERREGKHVFLRRRPRASRAERRVRAPGRRPRAAVLAASCMSYAVRNAGRAHKGLAAVGFTHASPRDRLTLVSSEPWGLRTLRTHGATLGSMGWLARRTLPRTLFRDVTRTSDSWHPQAPPLDGSITTGQQHPVYAHCTLSRERARLYAHT